MDSSYPFVFFPIHPSCNLPIELVNEILSYGDVLITKKYESVLNEMKQLQTNFYRCQDSYQSIWYKAPTNYYFYFILRHNFHKRKQKYPHLDVTRFLSKKITDENLVWVGDNYLTYFPLMQNSGFWYDVFPYEALMDDHEYMMMEEGNST